MQKSSKFIILTVLLVYLSFASINPIKDIQSNSLIISEGDWFSYVNNYDYNETLIVNHENSTFYNISWEQNYIPGTGYFLVNKTLGIDFTYDYYWTARISLEYINGSWVKNITLGYASGWRFWINIEGLALSDIITFSNTTFQVTNKTEIITQMGNFHAWTLENMAGQEIYWFDAVTGILVGFDTGTLNVTTPWHTGIWYLTASNVEFKTINKTDFLLTPISFLLIVITILIRRRKT